MCEVAVFHLLRLSVFAVYSFLMGMTVCSIQFYVDTVKQMALRQLVAGSPLRTLCLLIAGQPAEVFSSDTMINSNLPGAPQQSAQVRC